MRIYLLAVVLPAILLVAGGIRLVSLESARARSAVQEDLDERAAALSRDIVERLQAAKCDCRGIGRPPRPPARGRPKDRFGFWRRPPRDDCREHDLPADVRAVFMAAAAGPSQGATSKPRLVEIRHACGCAVASGPAPITGSIVGKASLKPLLPAYYVVVAPRGGDAEVAMGIRAQAMMAAILLLLLCGTLAAGVALLVRSARKAREEALRQTDFLSNVSHELKTPLTSIGLFSEMLAAGNLDGESSARAAATVAKEAKRLGRLIDGLLDYARLARGARTYSIEDFAAAPLLEETAAAFSPSFPGGLSVSCEDVRIHADREAVRRILDCLVENAAKYAGGSGEVALRCRAAAPADGGGGPRRCEISVADSGPGLSPAEARHVFDRFWRADNSVTRTAGGTGLGLAIARELAVGMGGSLSLSPNAPHGCIFTLSLEAAHG